MENETERRGLAAAVALKADPWRRMPAWTGATLGQPRERQDARAALTLPQTADGGVARTTLPDTP